jgi:hypothetical protein
MSQVLFDAVNWKNSLHWELTKKLIVP